MIVVAIIGILASIAIPKFADLIRKSNEGRTKGNLGALRSAINIYYGDMEGNYPVDDLSVLTINGKYLGAIPRAIAPSYHGESTVVRANFSGEMCGCGGCYVMDAGKWGYWSEYGSSCAGSNPAGVPAHNWGDVWLACTHTDSKGSFWTHY